MEKEIDYTEQWKEYAEHIGSAKREATALVRLEKAVPMIMKGKGLYDKYK